MANYIFDLGNETSILLNIPDKDSYKVSLIPAGTFIAFPTTSPIGFPYGIQSIYKVECSFTFTSRQELKDFLNFFHDRKGALRKFWLPLWRNEFELAEDVLQSSANMKIRNVNLSVTHKPYLRIFMYFPKGDLSQGDIFITRVTDCQIDTTDTSKEILTLATPTPIPIKKEAPLFFSRTILVRFTEDGIKLQVTTLKEKQAIVKVSCSFIELPHEYLET